MLIPAPLGLQGPNEAHRTLHSLHTPIHALKTIPQLQTHGHNLCPNDFILACCLKLCLLTTFIRLTSRMLTTSSRLFCRCRVAWCKGR